MMVRVVMLLTYFLAAASVPAAATVVGDWALDKVRIRAGHGRGGAKRKQRPKVYTRNGLRASCQA